MKKLFILLTLVALIMTNFMPLTNAKESTILQYNNIALLDFMFERLLLKKYISEKNLYKLATDLVEINKMVTGWLNNHESKFI